MLCTVTSPTNGLQTLLLQLDANECTPWLVTGRGKPDLVTSRLAALHFYQLAIPPPKPQEGSLVGEASPRRAAAHCCLKSALIYGKGHAV